VKISGSNFNHINPYQKQLQKQVSIQKSQLKEDKVEISSKAQELLKGNPIEEARKQEVENIKKAVQSGEYQINYEQTAKKMLEFWSNRP
jgi:negative regulator of flagellin synthesis FlgM